MEANQTLIAKCGLYCGACKKYMSGKCAGCTENKKATWCKIRTCCNDKGIANCAFCADFENTRNCDNHKGLMSGLFAFMFNSNRHACIDFVRQKGPESFALYMAANKKQTLPRK